MEFFPLERQSLHIYHLFYLMKEILLLSNSKKLPWGKKYLRVPPCRIFKLYRNWKEWAMHLMKPMLETCPPPTRARPSITRVCPHLICTHPFLVMRAFLSPMHTPSFQCVSYVHPSASPPHCTYPLLAVRIFLFQGITLRREWHLYKLTM
jgi:hypothetical protein